MMSPGNLENGYLSFRLVIFVDVLYNQHMFGYV